LRHYAPRCGSNAAIISDSNAILFYGPDEYEKWLAAGGFQEQEVRLVRKEMVSDRPVWLRVAPRGCSTQRVPEGEEFITAVADRYCRTSVRGTGRRDGAAGIDAIRL
jgi:hypothetical protein